MSRRAGKRAVKAASKSAGGVVVVVILVIVAIAAVVLDYKYGFIGIFEDTDGSGSSGTSSGGSTVGSSVDVLEGEYDDLAIHFFELGNSSSGDCFLIDVGDTEVLVDAGSVSTSTNTTIPYINNYCTDGVLEYVIATHADADHISGFYSTSSSTSSSTGIFDEYEVQTIIDFPKTDKTTTTYYNYVAARDAEVEEGATHYTALQCYNNIDGASSVINLSDDVSLTILYNYYYEYSHTDENNYSVCFYLTCGDHNFMFTGDLEEDGEEKLIKYNDIPQCTFFKAGHHGSATSSNEEFLAEVKPEIVAVPCCADDKYGFPTQDFIDRVAVYTDALYVPVVDDDDADAGYSLLNGNICISSDGEKVAVSCSNNNTKLKDTEWFAANRTWPS